MTLAYQGKLEIGAICPIVVTGTADAAAQLQANLTGALALEASLSITPPSVAEQITILTEFLAQLTAGVTLGVPSVSFNLAACTDLIASINASIGVLVTLQGLLGTAGVFAYTYDGAADALGAALTTELATQWPDGTPSTDHANAVILGTTDSGVWTDMLAFFGGL